MLSNFFQRLVNDSQITNYQRDCRLEKGEDQKKKGEEIVCASGIDDYDEK